MKQAINFFLLLFYLGAFSLHAQVWSGKIRGLNKQTAQLIKYKGMNSSILGFTQSDANGNFVFNTSEKLHKGLISLAVNENLQMEFIYTGKKIEFETDKIRPMANVKFINDSINTLFYQFLKQRAQYKMLLNYIRTNAADQNLADTIVYKLVETADNNFVASTNRILSQTKSVILKNIIKSLSYPVPLLETYDTTLYPKFKTDFFIQMLSDTKLFNDSILLYTPYLNSRLNLLYYNLLNNANNKKIETVSAKLISETQGENQTFIIDYLKEFFSINDRAQLLGWLNNYLKQNELNYCHAADLENSAKKLSLLEIGKTFPDTAFYGKEKNPVYVADIHTRKILVIFWRTSCPHCTALMKELKTIYKQLKKQNIDIFAVSIDDNKTDWAEFILKNDFKWFNFIDENAYTDGLLEKYNIMYTPKMYLLDAQKQIIAKPETFEDIKKMIE